ncbi:MAG: RNA polymerase sigma factor [Desulfobacterales bacterium]|nr:RNA polymerase sigma factor [Desulfobacterales bacterium]
MTHHSSNTPVLFREQLAQYLPRLKRFALNLTRDGESADDLVQSACEKALVKKEQYRTSSRLDSWLYRIMYTLWIDRIRRRKTRYSKLKILKGSDTSQGQAETETLRIDAKMDIQKALACLKPDQRTAVLLVMVEGYSYIQVSEILKVPPGTVASRVARARSILNDALSGTKPITPLTGQTDEGENNETAV